MQRVTFNDVCKQPAVPVAPSAVKNKAGFQQHCRKAPEMHVMEMDAFKNWSDEPTFDPLYWKYLDPRSRPVDV